MSGSEYCERHDYYFMYYLTRSSTASPCRDPEDNQFLALAMVAEAYALVSSDEDLLVLHPWRGIEIVTPAEFLRGKVLVQR